MLSLLSSSSEFSALALASLAEAAPNGAINDPKRSSIATTLLKWQRITPKGKAKYRSFFRHYYFWLKNYYCAVVQKKVEKISSTVSFLF